MDGIRPDTVVLNWLIALPFFVGAGAALFPRLSLPIHSEAEAESLRTGPFLLGAVASLMGLGLGISLLPAVLGGTPLTVDYWWTTDLYHLRFQADALSAPLVIAICGLGLLIHLYLAGLPALSLPHYRAALLLAAQGGAAAACLSADIIVLFFFLELTLVALWLLTSLDSRDAANGLLAAVHVGGLLVLGAVLLMWQRSGDTSTAALPLLLTTAEPEALRTIALLLLLGMLPNITSIPAHGWLPDLARAAPRMALAPALLLPLVGGASLLRLLPGTIVVSLVPALGAMALLLGVASLWWGAIRAWMAPSLHQLAAWLTVSQSGFLLIAIGAAASPTAPPELVRAAALHLLAAPAALVAAWSAACIIRARFGTDSIADLSGLLRTGLLPLVALFLGGLSLAGAPMLPGFQVQKLLVSGLVHDDRLWFAIVIVAADLLIAVAVLDALRRIGPRRESPPTARWQSAWLSANLFLGSAALLAVGLSSGPLGDWTQTVLRSVLSISRSGLFVSP